MKITTFSPLIVTNNIDKNVRLFESMGFKAAHKQNPEGDIYDFTIGDDDMSFLMSLPERGFSGEFADFVEFEGRM